MTAINQSQSLDLVTLNDLLNFVDADVSRAEWVTVLMAIKSEFGDSAKDLAREWSATAASFNAYSFQSTWRSIKSVGGITIATIIKQAKDNGWTPLPVSPEQREYLTVLSENRKAQQEKAAKQEADAMAEQHAKVSELAYRILESSEPAPSNHPYLKRKKIDPHGILFGSVLSYGKSLIIPVYGTHNPFLGLVQNVQSINEKGTKYFLKGGKKAGGYYPVQWIDDAPIVICEGFATGATLAEHYTPYSSVICAFDAGNLQPVARAFRQQYPTKQIIIAADNDRFTKTGQSAKKNVGIETATAVAKSINAALSIPHFESWESGSDWNDRYLLDLQGVKYG